MASLVSLNVGLPRDIAWRGQTVHTGIWKEAVQGRRIVRRLNIDGDGQGDTAGHGGEQRAVMVYQLDSYRYWENYLRRNDFRYGQFGENFTVDELPDNEVCIGDRYRIGTALFEVTQPRVTCYRVGIRLENPEMAALLVSHHRPGFYFRVLEEGDVGAGDEIRKVADGPERMSVAEIDALLYLPNHARGSLERSLRIPALSPGWHSSLQALLDQDLSGLTGSGNIGLTSLSAPPPAWPGFRPLRVLNIQRESAGVISLSFESPDKVPLPAALAGQFLVLKLNTGPQLPPVLRNYSMSGTPGADVYRISVKLEAHGIGSTFLHDRIKVGDILDVSAPRGNFTLRPGAAPVVLMSAGIGATPVLAMLHAIASTEPSREVWWLYGARNRSQHPFALEARELLKNLKRGHSYVSYSRPEPGDRLGEDYDAPGHLNRSVLERLSVPLNADYYVCGPAPFLTSLTMDLQALGVASTRIHKEAFGPEDTITPGIAPVSRKQPHAPIGVPGTGPQVSFTRSGLTVPWTAAFQNLLEFAEACDVPVKWACRTGVCHTCECALIGGAVDYSPDPLDMPSAGNFLTCCSKPHGDIEIDL